MDAGHHAARLTVHIDATDDDAKPQLGNQRVGARTLHGLPVLFERVEGGRLNVKALRIGEDVEARMLAIAGPGHVFRFEAFIDHPAQLGGALAGSVADAARLD